MRMPFLIIPSILLSTLLISNKQASHVAPQEQKNEAEQHNEIREHEIELTIAPVKYDDRAGDYVSTTSYKIGEEVRIALTMTNRTEQRTVIGWSDSLYQNRLKLQKNGQELEYLPELPAKISKMEKYGYMGSIKSIELQPNESKRIGLVYLKNWYAPLEAGQYQLKIKHKLFGEAKLANSNEVTFEVLP